MPLDGVHVSVRVVNLVAEVQVVQFYVNPTRNLIDTKYTFPLDESAAVCGFEAELDDKLLIGEVREKEEARAEYNAAISRGETAALLEQDKPDVFTQRIGNIRPLSRVNIRITYVADLKVESDGAVRFILPTGVAPRYTPYGSSYEGFTEFVPWKRNWRHVCLGRRVLYQEEDKRWCSQGTYVYENLPWYAWNHYIPEYVANREKPCAFSVTMELEMASNVTEIESPTHTMKWEKGTAVGAASASFWRDEEPMGKDLVLRIYQEKPHEPHVQVEVAPDGSGCAMVTMVPEFDMEPEPTEIIFLVDCSGSMSGSRIEAAVRALQVFLRALPMTCHFNIVKFGTTHQSLFNTSASYSQDTLQKASEHIAAMRANLGGTEILRPLKEIFEKSVAGGGRARQVFVLTDGEVSNTEAVIEICRRNAHNSRVFTVGIGENVSRGLVEGMAKAATGTAQFIMGTELSGSSSALEAKLLNQLKLATQPSLTKVIVDWGKLGMPKISSFFTGDSSSAASATVLEFSELPPELLVSGALQGKLEDQLGLEISDVQVDLETKSAKVTYTSDLDVDVSSVMHKGKQIKFQRATLASVTPSSGSGIFSSAVVATGVSVVAGKPSLLTINVRCNDVAEGEQIYITGDHSALGTWDPNKAVQMSEGTDNEWSATIIVSAGDNIAYKFIKKKADGYSSWETFEGNRTLFVPANSEGKLDAGNWNVKSIAPDALASVPAPVRSTVTATSTTTTSPPAGSKPVSKFFQTGPSQQRTGGSIHAIGSGPGFHAPGSLAPAVSENNDASSVQQHGRNADLYQAPFLPPPIFSNTRFVMYAFFAAGRIPIESVRISCESPSGPMDIDVPVTTLTSVGKTIHCLGARTLIRDLQDGSSHLHWRKTNVPPSLRGGGNGDQLFRGWYTGSTKAVGGAGQDSASAWGLEPVTPPANVVRNEMVDLGVRFGLVSAATSFVAVERWLDGHSGSSDTALPLPSQQQVAGPSQAEKQATDMAAIIIAQKKAELAAKKAMEQAEAMQKYAQEKSSSSSSSNQARLMAERIQARKRELAETKAREEEGAMMKYATEEAASTAAADQMKQRIERHKRELAEKKAAKEAEEMAAYMAEEVASTAAADQMKQRIEQRKRELSEQKAAKESEEMAAYMAEEAASNAAAAQMKARIEQHKRELAEKKAAKEAEEMTAYMAEEAASTAAADQMKARIEQRKKELAEKKAAKEAEEMEAYMAEEAAAIAAASGMTQRREKKEEQKPYVPSGPPPTNLYMQQQFDGSFLITDALATLLHTTAASLRDGAASAASKMGSIDETTSRNVWASLYVVALLQKWWFDYESSWEMIADKAKQYCVSALTKSLGDRTAARRLVDALVASI